MAEMWQAVAAIAVVLGTLAGIIKWLLEKYFEKQEELEALKKRNSDIMLENLSGTVDAHKKELRNLKNSLDLNTAALCKTDVELKDLAKQVSKYSDSTEARMQKFETQLIKIGEDLYLVKGRPNGKKGDQ